jgi:hypothetical protein
MKRRRIGVEGIGRLIACSEVEIRRRREEREE